MLTFNIVAAETEAVVIVVIALSPVDLFFHCVGKVGRRGRVFLVESCARALSDNFAACLPASPTCQPAEANFLVHSTSLVTVQTEITMSRAPKVACMPRRIAWQAQTDVN